MDRARRRVVGWEEDWSFYFLIFFVNRFVVFFSYSVLPSSLLNTRLHFHVIHPHLIIQHKVSFSSRFISFFFFKNKKNKILCNFTCDLLLCLRISDLKCGQAKTPKQMGPWEKMFPFFWSHLLALISRRNVGTKGHLRKEIVLLKYQFFRFMTKSGGQFEIDWRKAQGFWCWRIMIFFILPSVSKLSSMLRTCATKR